MRRLRPTLLVAMLPACASTNTTEVIDAAVGTGVGIAGAAINRATGGCYSVCEGDTRCNPNTGLCEHNYEDPPRPPALAAVTLPERCAMYRRDQIEERKRGIGDQHPAMVTLQKVLARCDQLLSSQDPIDRQCGTFELELYALESDGLGKSHPEVIAQTEAWSACKTEAAKATGPAPSP